MLYIFISKIEYILSKLDVNNTGGKHPLTDEWIKKMCIYMMEYYSVVKKNEITVFFTELEQIISQFVWKYKKP